jgi:hypothetical protein
VYLWTKELVIQLGHCKVEPIREAEVDGAAAAEVPCNENLLLKLVIYHSTNGSSQDIHSMHNTGIK